jgi:hypothetical protein
MDVKLVQSQIAQTSKAMKGLQVIVTTGSMADVPKDLLTEIKKLEELFMVDTALMKKISAHFITELDKGESPMNNLLLDAKLTALRTECCRWQHCTFSLIRPHHALLLSRTAD